MPIILQSQCPNPARLVNGNVYQLQQKRQLSTLLPGEPTRTQDSNGNPWTSFPYGSQDSQKLSIGRGNYFRSGDT